MSVEIICLDINSNFIDTGILGGILQTWYFTTTITLLPPVASTTIVHITKTINGGLTTFTFTTTYSNLPIGGAEVTHGRTLIFLEYP